MDNTVEESNFIEDYIDSTSLFVKFMIASKQWSSLSLREVNIWKNNFDSNLVSQYYSSRLLSHFLYYSEHDMELMLKKGVEDIIVNSVILQEQLKSNFSCLPQDLSHIYNSEISKTLFIPLLDKNKPHESGNQMARILVQKLGISQSNTTFHYDLSDLHSKYTRVVIVDDCIGSGHQFTDFLDTAQTRDNSFLMKWCSDNNIQLFYLSLIGFKNTVERLNNTMTNISIHCVQLVDECLRVFNDESYVWTDKSEMINAKEHIQSILNSVEVPLMGYNNLDFLVAMHSNIPDWSLPLLWKSRDNWQLLMRRKNSDD